MKHPDWVGIHPPLAPDSRAIPSRARPGFAKLRSSAPSIPLLLLHLLHAHLDQFLYFNISSTVDDTNHTSRSPIPIFSSWPSLSAFNEITNVCPNCIDEKCDAKGKLAA
jgi:hypothetical protein